MVGYVHDEEHADGMEFAKVHGTGNDFVLLPDLEDRLEITAELVRALCTPHLGLGADGVIRLGGGDGTCDVFMDYRNADGSAVEMCGNGVRCVAKYVVDRGIADGDVVRVGTRGGVKTVDVVARHADGTVAQVRVDMGAPVVEGSRRVDVSPLRVAEHAHASGGVMTAVTAEQRLVDATALSMGNPHLVLLVDDVDAAPVRDWGPLLERDRAYPDGTNVEFISAPSRDRVVGRIWERGVGETLASGTGASAMAVAAHVLGLVDRSVTVALPGGELRVDWTDDTLYVTGPAEEVAEGRLAQAWLQRVVGRT